MKTLTRFLAPALIVSLFAACGAPEKPAKKYLKLQKAAWFLGTWENVSDEGTAVESWKPLNDSTYAGKAWFMIGADTVTSESILLQENNGELLYIPTVRDQNGGESVPFRLTHVSARELVFENPEHDFPQKIRYRKHSPTAITADISGKMDGEFRQLEFPMTRKKSAAAPHL